MKRLLFLAGVLLCLAVPKTALAQGLHLAWNGCGNAGVTDNAFACNSNATLHHLVSSFDAPPGITSFIGATTEVLVSSFQPLGPWWALLAGGCRAGALLSEDPSGLALGDCSTATFDGSQNLGLANFEPNYQGNPNQAKITVETVRTDEGAALEAGREYQANVIQIRSTKTTGTGACAGCTQPLILYTLGVFIAMPDGTVELASYGPPCVGWRGGPGCTVTTRRQSWGEVKSLYR